MEKLYIKRTDTLVIQRKEDSAFIPQDTDNIDYQKYMELCDQYGETEITEVQ